ncbi:MAG: response regulator transcription factor [Microthrixaceae bacterium]
MRADHSRTGTRILVAEDDRAIRDSLRRLLEINGYEVVTATDGVAALESRRRLDVGLVLLDVMMPSVDGLSVCRVLRAEGDNVPIMILTALTDPSERVAGLDAGADDYLIKPFDPGELLARVRALLRRSRDRSGDTSDPVIDRMVRVGDLSLDPAARRVWRGNVEIGLSRIEFDLLELLMRNAGIVLSRSQIYERIWDYDFGPESKNLAVYISYLRRKIDDPADVALIQTIRGVGYTLREPEGPVK